MQNLPASIRLRGKTRMGEIFANGSHAAAGTVLARALPNSDGTTRVAAVAGRKLGGAVARNRMKRRLRAAFRTNKKCFPEGWDIALIARRGLLEAEWSSLIRDMEKAVSRAVASFGRPRSPRQG